jgi:hypothetical protein
MTDDSFTHAEGRFDAAALPAGVDIDDAEAKYAELFAEVIWDGLITPDKRNRLATAAQVFGVALERVRRIEEALTAAYEARHRIEVVERGTEPPSAPRSVAPLGPQAGADSARGAIERRLELLERRNEELTDDNDRLRDHVDQLEQLVAQLQHALESTLEELDATHKRLAAAEEARQAERRVDGAPVEPASTALVDDEGPAPSSVVQPVPGAAAPPGPPPPRRNPPTSIAGVAPEAVRSETRARSRRLLRDSSPPAAPPGEDATPRLGSLGAAASAAAAIEVASPSDAPEAGARAPQAEPPAPAPRPEAQRQRPSPRSVRPSRGDPAEIHRLLRANPRDPELLRALHRALGRGEDIDRRWCIAHALVHLGHANAEERALHDAHAHGGLVRPARAINEDEWRELLTHPEEDLLTGEILAEIAPAVLLGQLATMRASIAPEMLDPKQRVDPKSSTLQAVRCFAWAAAFLGLRVPPLYVAPDLHVTADVILEPRPATRLGQQALVGRSSRELAFIAGRHLSWYRREHLLGRPTRSVRRLEDMFVAALTIGNPELPMTPEIRERVEPIAKAIRPLLTQEAVERLQQCFTRFVETGGRTNLARWLESADKTSLSAGLLLANDLGAARAMLALEEPEELEARMDELIVFFTAGRCSLLRRRVGIAVTAK